MRKFIQGFINAGLILASIGLVAVLIYNKEVKEYILQHRQEREFKPIWKLLKEIKKDRNKLDVAARNMLVFFQDAKHHLHPARRIRKNLQRLKKRISALEEHEFKLTRHGYNAIIHAYFRGAKVELKRLLGYFKNTLAQKRTDRNAMRKVLAVLKGATELLAQKLKSQVASFDERMENMFQLNNELEMIYKLLIRMDKWWGKCITKASAYSTGYSFSSYKQLEVFIAAYTRKHYVPVDSSKEFSFYDGYIPHSIVTLCLAETISLLQQLSKDGKLSKDEYEPATQELKSSINRKIRRIIRQVHRRYKKQCQYFIRKLRRAEKHIHSPAVHVYRRIDRQRIAVHYKHPSLKRMMKRLALSSRFMLRYIRDLRRIKEEIGKKYAPVLQLALCQKFADYYNSTLPDDMDVRHQLQCESPTGTDSRYLKFLPLIFDPEVTKKEIYIQYKKKFYNVFRYTQYFE